MRSDMAASIVITLYLKEQGCNRIIVKVKNSEHEKVIRMMALKKLFSLKKIWLKNLDKT